MKTLAPAGLFQWISKQDTPVQVPGEVITLE